MAVRYAGIIYDDTASAPGVCLSFFVQGCPLHCNGCHNPHTWDFDGGYAFTEETVSEVIRALRKNGVNRNLCIMGGEPLAPANVAAVAHLVRAVRETYPSIKIYLWSGYTMEEILYMGNDSVTQILSGINYLIDGPFRIEQRDITLKMRGSKNQRIFRMVNGTPTKCEEE